jgi:hypothetical protein
MYLKKRNIDRGTVVHFYLSQLIRGTAEEKSRATPATVSRFGTCFHRQRCCVCWIRSIASCPRTCLPVFRSLAGFHGQTVFSPQGKELRIDRLLVDGEGATGVIVDYKTGAQYDDLQMHAYRRPSLRLPVVQQGGRRRAGRIFRD